MKIGVISDTHDQIARTAAGVALLLGRGAEALIHCGDLTGPEIVHECGLLPCSYVFGNNDDEEHALRAAMRETGGACLERGGTVELAGRRIAVTHGDSLREVRRLMELEPDYLFSGHTHLISDRVVGKVRCINPGALHRAARWTVALLDLDAGSLEILDVGRSTW